MRVGAECEFVGLIAADGERGLPCLVGRPRSAAAVLRRLLAAPVFARSGQLVAAAAVSMSFAVSFGWDTYPACDASIEVVVAPIR